MRRVMFLAMTLAVLMGLTALSAIAGGPHDKATGTVTWTARTHLPPAQQLPGLITSFNAHDLGPGMDDKGSLTTFRPTDAGFSEGNFTMDLKCVRVVDNVAWFAGEVTSADGGYSDRVGDFTAWRVEDNTTPGSGGDLIGGTGPKADLVEVCDIVAAGSFGGTGVVTSGNLKTHYTD